MVKFFCRPRRPATDRLSGGERHRIVGRMVGIVLIGDEILGGQVHDENLPVLVSALTGVGHDVSEVRIVGDRVPAIAEAVRALLGRCDHVVTAGGIGPTHDDVTLEGVVEALGVGSEHNRTMHAFLVSRYGDPLPDGVGRMADMPVGTDVIGCEEGRWPLIRCGRVFVLPGLPVALRDKVQRLTTMLAARSARTTRELTTMHDESAFAGALGALQQGHPSVKIGSYPVVGRADYRVRLTFSGLDADAVDRALAAAAAMLGAIAPARR